MAELLLKGKPVADALDKETAALVESSVARGVVPTLAIVRVGEKPDDLAYEQAAKKRCEKLGIVVRVTTLPASVEQAELETTVRELNDDAAVHGLLLLRPFPKHIDGMAICNLLDPAKDLDGVTGGSMRRVYANEGVGFAPCTAEAVVRILKHYDIPIRGKKITIVGRSLVIGRPVAMLLMHENATITICHRQTADTPAETRAADIVVAALGEAEALGADFFRAGQTVIDVGIHWNEEKQKLAGDVAFDEVEPIVNAITPVPGGVGSVTTAVLAHHVAGVAEKGFA